VAFNPATHLLYLKCSNGALHVYNIAKSIIKNYENSISIKKTPLVLPVKDTKQPSGIISEQHNIVRGSGGQPFRALKQLTKDKQSEPLQHIDRPHRASFNAPIGTKNSLSLAKEYKKVSPDSNPLNSPNTGINPTMTTPGRTSS